MKEVDFFVVGAQKSGTTFLHALLSSDERIALPEIKETHFFCDDIISRYPYLVTTIKIE